VFKGLMCFVHYHNWKGSGSNKPHNQ